MICPECGSDEHLTVEFTGQAYLTSDGTEDCGDHTWDAGSKCSCECGAVFLVGEAITACENLNKKEGIIDDY